MADLAAYVQEVAYTSDADDFMRNLDGAVAKARIGQNVNDDSVSGEQEGEPGAHLVLGIVLEPAKAQAQLGMFTVHSIMRGSVAATQTNIRKGDALVAVDGVSVRGRQLEEVMELMIRAYSFILHREIKPLAR